MARILNLATNEAVEVNGRTVFGRSARADCRLGSGATSSEHALVSWDGSAWSLRDLVSTNGTRLNDKPLGNRPARLVVGDVVTFGDPSERWRWTDPAPPLPRAVCDDGTVIVGSPTLLQLPNPNAPEMSVFWNGSRWELDSGDSQRPIDDGERLTVGGKGLSLKLPELEPAAEPTIDLGSARTLANANLSFNVSLDREHITMLVKVGHGQHEFASRSFNSLLLELARARLDERGQGIPESEAGWTYADTLSRALGTSVQKLNVDVHRARRGFEQCKLFSDAASVIERRPSTGQLRIGIESLAVVGAGETQEKTVGQTVVSASGKSRWTGPAR